MIAAITINKIKRQVKHREKKDLPHTEQWMISVKI